MISTMISALTLFIKDKLTTIAIIASINRTEPPITWIKVNQVNYNEQKISMV